MINVVQRADILKRMGPEQLAFVDSLPDEGCGRCDVARLSIGIESGPPFGVQKGPRFEACYGPPGGDARSRQV